MKTVETSLYFGELTSYETLTRGTYNIRNGKYMITTTEFWRTVDGSLVKDEDVTPYTSEFIYQVYSNGFLSMAYGGVNYFVPEGQERKIVSLQGHELLGRWEIHQSWADQPYRETVSYIILNADGTMEEGAEQWDTENNRMFQGSMSKGFFVILDNAFVKKIMDGTDVNLPTGAKVVSFIEDVAYYYEQTSATSGSWKFSAARFGGHPNQYVLKNGKLYWGILGQEEKYFFSDEYNGYTKKK